MYRPFLIAVAVALPLAACSKSPTDPSGGGGGDMVLRGQTVSAIDGVAAPNLSVRIGDRTVNSDGSGNFQLDLGSSGIYRATIRGTGVVERETRITGPGAGVTRVSMIPSSYDLDAFNQMFRTLNSRLARWTTRPSLVVLGTVMDYRGTGETYEATGESMTDDEVSLMISHLTEGLAFLTGSNYQLFTSVNVERPAAGTRVSPFRSGTIVVGRYKGIVDVRADDRLRPVVGDDRRQHRRRRDVPRPRVRSRRLAAPPAPRPRAGARARVSARGPAAVDHESVDRRGTERLRSRRRVDCLPAAGRERVARRRSGVGHRVAVHRRRALVGADDVPVMSWQGRRAG